MTDRVFVSLSPFRCRMWHFHDRLEEYINAHSCQAELTSVAKHGQLVPVLGRPVRNDPAYDAELIYGARRLFMARHLNLPLTIELREITDREAIVAMDIENRHRKDISAYERGMSYARWLREQQFQSQDELAQTLRVSPSQVSRLLQLAKLPEVVVAAFRRSVEICETWGLDLARACSDPEKRRLIVQQARAITVSSMTLSSPEVYRKLMGFETPTHGRVRHRVRDDVVKSIDGRPLFRIRQQRRNLALLLPLGGFSAGSLERIRAALIEILQAG